ncbi:ABC transporter substrate-binding protein [Kocuria rhizophila]
MKTHARTRRIGTRLSVGALGLVTSLMLVSCGEPAGVISGWELTDTTAAPGGDVAEFSWALQTEPFSLDYAYAFDYADNQVLANVCEPLLRLEPDFSLQPGLAESWENPDPTTWVYHLRPNVKFHDGSVMTADDAVASMRRHLDPAVGSFWASVYQNVESVEKTAPLEVTVRTRIPDSQFNEAMGTAAGVVESAQTLEDKGADYGNSSGGVNCTGPLSFSEWSSGESIRLTRFDDYWDPKLRAHAGTVDFMVMPDANSRTNALRAGEVDGAWTVPPDSIPLLRDGSGSGSGGDVYFGNNSTVASMVVGDMEGPLGDVRVRKALMMALDREGILKAGYGGYGEVTDALTVPFVWHGVDPAVRDEAFSSLSHYERDVDAAKQLVREAGAEGKEVTIATAPIGNDFSVTSQATAAALTELGMKPTIKTVTPNEYTTLFSDPNARKGVDLFYTQWYVSSPDALEMYSVLRSGEFSNYGGWKNPEFDELVNRAVQTEDPTKRAELTAQAQRIANDQLPWLPLFAPPTSVYLSDRITGVSPSINFMYYPWAATVGAR